MSALVSDLHDAIGRLCARGVRSPCAAAPGPALPAPGSALARAARARPRCPCRSEPVIYAANSACSPAVARPSSSAVECPAPGRALAGFGAYREDGTEQATGSAGRSLAAAARGEPGRSACRPRGVLERLAVCAVSTRDGRRCCPRADRGGIGEGNDQCRSAWPAGRSLPAVGWLAAAVPARERALLAAAASRLAGGRRGSRPVSDHRCRGRRFSADCGQPHHGSRPGFCQRVRGTAAHLPRPGIAHQAPRSQHGPDTSPHSAACPVTASRSRPGMHARSAAGRASGQGVRRFRFRVGDATPRRPPGGYRACRPRWPGRRLPRIGVAAFSSGRYRAAACAVPRASCGSR